MGSCPKAGHGKNTSTFAFTGDGQIRAGTGLCLVARKAYGPQLWSKPLGGGKVRVRACVSVSVYLRAYSRVCVCACLCVSVSVPICGPPHTKMHRREIKCVCVCVCVHRCTHQGPAVGLTNAYASAHGNQATKKSTYNNVPKLPKLHCTFEWHVSDGKVAVLIVNLVPQNQTLALPLADVPGLGSGIADCGAG